jgi:hypothetical protein
MAMISIMTRNMIVAAKTYILQTGRLSEPTQQRGCSLDERRQGGVIAAYNGGRRSRGRSLKKEAANFPTTAT